MFYSYVDFLEVCDTSLEYFIPWDRETWMIEGGRSSQSRMLIDELHSRSCLFSLYQNLSQAGDLACCSMWKAAISSHQMIFCSLLSEGFACVLWLMWSHWGYSLQYGAHRTHHSEAAACEIRKSSYLFLSSVHE